MCRNGLRANVIPAEHHDHQLTHNWPGSQQPWGPSQQTEYGLCSSAHSIDRPLASSDGDALPDLPSDWESWFGETFDVSDPAWEAFVGAHDVGLCPGPSQAQGPISSERPNVEPEPERTIDNLSNLAPDVRSSVPGLFASLDVNFGFNSNLNHSSQNPSIPSVDPAYMTGNVPLANDINPPLTPGDLTEFDLPAPSWPSNSPSTIFDDLFSNVPSLDSLPTQSTSPSLLSQSDTQHSRRLPLPPLGISKFRCLECASTFAMRGQLRRHEKTHNSSLCDFEGCNKTFKASKDLLRHKNTVHADQVSTPLPLQTCDRCTYGTRRPDHFKRHKETHQTGKKKRKRQGD